MFQSFLLISLLILGVYIVLSDNLRYSIITLGVFSLTMSLTYLHYNAPDVALAEVAIGVGLSTVMYLVALKKVQVYDICYVNEDVEDFNDSNIHEISASIIRPLEIFIEKTEELEPQMAFTNHSIEEVLCKDNHDFIILKRDACTSLYGKRSDEVFQNILSNIEDIIPDMTNVQIIYIDEVIEHASE